MVEIGDILVLVCVSRRAVRLSGPILIVDSVYRRNAAYRTHQNNTPPMAPPNIALS